MAKYDAPNAFHSVPWWGSIARTEFCESSALKTRFPLDCRGMPGTHSLGRKSAEPGSRLNRLATIRPASYSLPRVNSTRDIDYLFYEDRAFRFRQPITIEVFERNGVWVNEYKPLGIKSYGRTELEALRAFAEEFSSCWFWIARERDSLLDQNAQET